MAKLKPVSLYNLCIYSHKLSEIFPYSSLLFKYVKSGNDAVIHVFSFADALAFTNAYFGEHSSPGTTLTNLYCYGSESRLIGCSYSTTTSCSASYVAGVRCQGKTVAGIKL